MLYFTAVISRLLKLKYIMTSEQKDTTARRRFLKGKDKEYLVDKIFELEDRLFEKLVPEKAEQELWEIQKKLYKKYDEEAKMIVKEARKKIALEKLDWNMMKSHSLESLAEISEAKYIIKKMLEHGSQNTPCNVLQKLLDRQAKAYSNPYQRQIRETLAKNIQSKISAEDLLATKNRSMRNKNFVIAALVVLVVVQTGILNNPEIFEWFARMLGQLYSVAAAGALQQQPGEMWSLTPTNTTTPFKECNNNPMSLLVEAIHETKISNEKKNNNSNNKQTKLRQPKSVKRI